MPDSYDIFIIGGGINGCGVARDAAGRGYKVGLAEMNDLASGTSSWSTKLIHGGLRYLEYYEFRLVREALKEREVLWRIAPHIIQPLRFILPHAKDLRPAWFLRIGLFLYDHLGGRKDLPGTRTLDLRQSEYGRPLKSGFAKGFEYSDAQVDDARLVVLNARDAAQRGADIMVRTKVVSAHRHDTSWDVELLDCETNETRRVSARCLVNLAGPWVDKVLRKALGRHEARHVRLVQGSHIVVPRLYRHDRAYIFQNADGRIIFAIPYQDEFTLIGTTDQDYDGDPAAVAISDAEIDYLCAAASEYLAEPVRRSEIVWAFSGVRPLFDDGASKAQEATRDYVLKVDHEGGRAPLLNDFGGKITTYRKLAEEVIEKIGAVIGPKGARWTAKVSLPGGDFPHLGLDDLAARIADSAPACDAKTARRLTKAYGTDAFDIVKASNFDRFLGHGLSEAEVDWLIDKEWARTADDILWRRSKLGLHFSKDETMALASYVDQRTRKVDVAAI
ncbi:glycerol-3-phosphate dehydrogenase [Consotaella aegiceratis]|uniref:glycerol-3-phosphate dehydrogenase n=1 Tax=Consotaella aegiceratis TaxID=3097961 RepID=UPI002F423C58